MSLINYIFKNQWLPADKLQEIQNKRLKKLINYAYNNVPYYQRLFKENDIMPNDINSSYDLKKIPITTKSDIQKLSLDQIISKNIRIKNCNVQRTSGSTGKPLNIYLSKRDEIFRSLIDFRSYLSMGCRIFDKLVLIRTPALKLIKVEVEDKLTYIFKRTISGYIPLKRQIDLLKEFNPHIIWAFPNNLKLIARFISEKEEIYLKPKIIFSSGEILNNRTRNFLERVFNAEVYDFYTSTEFSTIALECKKHDGYHINFDSVIVEITKDGKKLNNGEEGEIICTNLINYTMPLIRYNLEDIGVISEKLCECGRSFPLLKKIIGRCDDMLILRNGTNLHNNVFSVNFYNNIPGLFQFKLIQEDFEKFKLFYSPKGIINNDLKIQIQNNFQKHINNVQIDFIGVDNIPKDKSGKFRKFISLIPEKDKKS